MSTARHIVVVSSINRDTTLHLPHFPQRGETILASHTTHSLGGKGANVAVAARRSGLERVYFAGAVGEDGIPLLQDLEEYGVDVSLVERRQDVATGAAVVMLEDGGENRIIVSQGANGKYRGGDDRLDDVMRGAVVVLQNEITGEVVETVARRAKGVGAVVVLNPSPWGGQGGFGRGADAWRCVDLVVVNEVEGREICGEACKVDEVGRVVRSWGGEHADVVVTLGADGVWYSRAQERQGRRVRGLRVERVVDTTGAGDCFLGVLVTGLAGGGDWEESVRRAVVAAGICVEREGAAVAMPTQGEVEERLVTFGG